MCKETDVKRPRGWPPARSARGRVGFEKNEAVYRLRSLLGLTTGLLLTGVSYKFTNNLYPVSSRVVLLNSRLTTCYQASFTAKVDPE